MTKATLQKAIHELPSLGDLRRIDTNCTLETHVRAIRTADLLRHPLKALRSSRQRRYVGKHRRRLFA